MFTPTWGNDPIWRAYFSDGWFNHQLVCKRPVQWLWKVWPLSPWQFCLRSAMTFEALRWMERRVFKMQERYCYPVGALLGGLVPLLDLSLWFQIQWVQRCFLLQRFRKDSLLRDLSKVGFFNEYIRDQEEFDVHTVDGWNLAPPGMYETLQIMG